MEDFVWIFVVLAVWLFEIAGKGLKKQRQSSVDDESTSRPDPRSTERNLAREMDASARHAEDALQRWEAKQSGAELAPASATIQPRVSKTQRRHESFEAIAALLAAPAEQETKSPTIQRRLAVAKPLDATVGSPRSKVRPKVESHQDPVTSVRHSERPKFGGLVGLSELERAVVLSEILGPPVSLQNRHAFHLNSD